MMLFSCSRCGNTVYFGNTACARCGAALGFAVDRMRLVALTPGPGPGDMAETDGTLHRYCANHDFSACNWLVPATFVPGTLCAACRLNRWIPDLSVPANLTRWRRVEYAKHCLVYALVRLGLPIPNRLDDPGRGLAFDVLSDEHVADPTERVMTGHDGGIVTINVREADPAEREKLRQALGEPYRTLIGHFRHEIAHFYWALLVDGTPEVEAFRAVFGDERADYQEALAAHYRNGPAPDWALSYVSAYASSHPWEDFAETWAHYLHIVDTLDTAYAFGLTLKPRVREFGPLSTDVSFAPYAEADFDRLIATWVPLTAAVNSLNDSMGQPDLYPFVLSDPVIEKLRYIHGLIFRAARREGRTGPPRPAGEVPERAEAI